MIPAPFAYARATSVDDAIELLGRSPGARVMAGGQALIPLLKRRAITPPSVIAIGRLSELAYVRADEDTLHIGALTSDLQLLSSPWPLDRCPIVKQIAGLSQPLARSLGSVGGSLLSTESASGHAAVLLALDASVELRSQRGSRTLPLAELYDADGGTRMAPDELLVEVSFPVCDGDLNFVYERFARHAGDAPVVGVVVAVARKAQRVSHARIGVVGASPSPFIATDAQHKLVGASLTPALIDQAADMAAREANPTSDPTYPAEYKRDLVRTLTVRALSKAMTEELGLVS